MRPSLSSPRPAIAHSAARSSNRSRRERYLPPLRMYLLASFLFFLFVKVLSASGGSHIVIAPAMDSRGTPLTESTNPDAYRAAVAEMQACVDKPGSIADPVGVLVISLYALWALHRVYGGRWWATPVRAALMVVLYVPALLATIVALSIASLFLA